MSDPRPETIEPQRPVTAQRPAEPVAGAGNTLFVACKHPNGLELTCYDQVEAHLATPGGVEKTKVWKRNGARSFLVEGPAMTVNPHAAGPHLMRFKEQFGGYSITPGCPKDVWEHWSKFNQNMLEAKIVQAFSSQSDAIAWCRTQRDVRSGLEPIDPLDPGASTGIRGIERADTAPAR